MKLSMSLAFEAHDPETLDQKTVEDWSVGTASTLVKLLQRSGASSVTVAISDSPVNAEDDEDED